jgi:hypothetical protein
MNKLVVILILIIKKKYIFFKCIATVKIFKNENNKKMGGGDIDNPPGFSFE